MKRQLQEEHKENLISLFDENSFETMKDAADSLTEALEGFTLKETIVGSLISNECNISIKRVVVPSHKIMR